MVFHLPAVALVLILACSAGALSQSTTPTRNESDDVVKITTKLVQIDVVVTDKQGNPVKELGPNDFILLQDGKPQTITALNFVSAGPSRGVTAPAETRESKARPGNVLPPPVTSSDGQGRVIAFLIDDGACGASVVGLDTAKTALRRFIREQMLAGDLVAIYRTRAGTSAFQQYTSDRAALLRAADRIRWYPPQGSCASSDGTFNEAARANQFQKLTDEGVKTVTIESEAERRIREYDEDQVQSRQIVGTLGVIRYALSGLEKAPGRKTMFFMSDGLALRNRQNRRLDTADVMRDLTEAANRAAVVIHTFDLRAGDIPGFVEAKDEVLAEADFNVTEPISDRRRQDATRARDGLETLAYETGGEFHRGTDRPDATMAKVLRQGSEYYLLAFEPDEGTFKNKKFNRIEVKVNRPELKVAYRSGFIGVPDAPAQQVKRKSGDSELYEAIAAPLPRPGLNLALSASFGNSAAAGNYVRAFFHLDGRELVFTEESKGQRKAVFDVVAVTMDEKNVVIDEFTRTHTLKFDAATADRINRDGLIYTTDIPIKKSGNYNFRVAVRDANSKLIGTAAQVVQIPDLKRSDIFLSGLTVSAADQTGKFETVGPTTVETAITLPTSSSVPAIRRFQRGSVIAYAYSIYNSRKDPATGKPKLAVTVNLYKDGELVVEGAPNVVQMDAQSDWSRAADYGYMRLNAQAAPGEYALQVIVRDLLGGKNSVTSQWVDLEIID
jgi:VWFA-related protein